MAALNFVAAEDGLEDDPKLRTLARLLKVTRPMAFWFVMRWQRLIVQRGNHVLGSLPKNYTADDIAAFLDFDGDSRRLVRAMKKQGYVSYKKGRGFFYPAWKESITGRYTCRREEDRQWHERKRHGERLPVDRPSTDVVSSSSDASGERRTTSERGQVGRNEGRDSDRPPDPPPVGGDFVADARWKWIAEHAPTPQNRDACKRILGVMSEDDWALVQTAYGSIKREGAYVSRKNRRAIDWPTDQFLRKQAYLRFLPGARPTKSAPRRPTTPNAEDPLAAIERRLVAGDQFLMDLLGDPDQPEEKKNEARNRWLADPANKGRRPPWVIALPHPIGAMSP